MTTTVRPPRRHADVPAGCPLTSREYVVVKLLADGLTYGQIADQLGRTTSTIRHQLHTAYRRLNVPGGMQAVIYCYRAGWLTQDALPDVPPPPVRREDRVSPAQALYLEAIQRWLRTGDPDDRHEALALLRIVRRQGRRD